MRNKYINNDFGFNISDDDYKWTDKKLSMDDVISVCVANNYCFDIVTERFEKAGEGLVNSVATDCEILSATSSILSLLLSSNQLLSINKMYDRKRGRQQIIADKREEITSIVEGIVEVLQKHDCMFFDDLTDDDDEYDREVFNDYIKGQVEEIHGETFPQGTQMPGDNGGLPPVTDTTTEVELGEQIKNKFFPV
jgi:hypothetical protein